MKLLPRRHSQKTRQRIARRRRLLSFESLELRQLLAANITGTVVEDLNRDGLNNNGENGVSGWTVFLDANKDGILDSGESSAVTDQDGIYNFKNVAPGDYRVGLVGQAGWVGTSPASQDVVAGASGNVTADFLVFSGGGITGTVWNDLNQDQIRATDTSGAFTEPGLAGWTVFLDLDTNGNLDSGEPSTLTDADGIYHFNDLPAIDFEVTEILPAGWVTDIDTKQTVSVVARQTKTQDFVNYSTTNGSIQGTVFSDLNANGTRDLDPATGLAEPGLEGWTVFIDLNNNSTLDSGEVSTVTDAHGQYSFLSLSAGDYEVTEVLQAGWDVTTNDIRQTVAVSGGSASTASDFGNFTTQNGSIQGAVWNDLNRNGVRDVNPLTGAFTDLPLAGWTMFLDLNRNGVNDSGEPTEVTDANGWYQFLDLQVGEYEVQEVIKSGWEVAPTFAENQTVRVYSGVDAVAGDFANFNVSASTPGSVSGVVWNDLNENGVREAAEPGLDGWTVFLDSNLDGLFTVGEPTIVTGTDGNYSFSGVAAGTVGLGVVTTTGWHATAPLTNTRSLALRSGQRASGLNFGEAQLKDSSIGGKVYVDDNKNGIRDASDRGLPGITVYLDLNHDGALDAGEPSVVTSDDLYYTPGVNEAGDYRFTHLAAGTYHVREIVPLVLSATDPAELEHTVSVTAAQDFQVDSKATYRPNEIHGMKFEDVNGNHIHDAGDLPMAGVTIFIDTNRNNSLDTGEPTTTTGSDGAYTFTGMAPGAYVVREIVDAGYVQTFPTTLGGDLWPSGTSNAAVGNVSPTSITKPLAIDEKFSQSVTITLPTSGALTNLVDVFLLFDDTGSFTGNSPIVRAAFPQIITSLNTALPGVDLGFGVGRLEEYGNFASEYATGRPFILNQPIVAASTAGYETAIQAALDRTAPGYGGDAPETDIEALYQLVTGKGFDGNNNGSVLDSGPAGLASTQLHPGPSGDVPSFASFTPDAAANVFPAAGNVGGAGFRAGALPIVLLATDTGFAYQPKGETPATQILGTGGVSLPVSQLTQTARATTPYNSGAGIQETITGLNALGALVIGLGTNPQATIDPRQQLEAISKLTGATNQTTTTIDNGTSDPIAPGDPMYFQIASGFSASVANGVISAIQNAVTNVAVDLDVIASDPRVQIVNKTGVLKNIGSGQSATFDLEFTGDGRPHRFDLQFVRAGTNVVLGSIPVVFGTPVPGDGYEYDELEDGEIEVGDDFGNRKSSASPNVAPSFVVGDNQNILEDAGAQQLTNWATSISPGPASEAGQTVDFMVTNDNPALFASQPAVSSDGTLTYTPAADAFGVAIVILQLHDNGGTAGGGVDTSDPQSFTITVNAVNDAPVAAGDSYSTSEDAILTIAATGVLGNDSDIDGDALTAIQVAGPTSGSLTLNSDGSFTYTPNANFNGSDSFTYQADDGALLSTTATVLIQVKATLEPGGTKFLIVDQSRRRTFEYDAAGNSLGDNRLNKEDQKARGIATNADGSTLWVVDSKGEVFIYDNANRLLGSWEIESVDKPEGVTVHGDDLWIVDREADRVFFFAGGALRRSGHAEPTSSFRLDRGNRNPMDLVTDGSHIWVVNDTRAVDQVFRYSVKGTLEGSWQIDAANAKPTGLTIDAADVNDIWIVDSGSDSVYQYDGAAGRTSGQQSANPLATFALNAANRNAQGLAAPRPSAPAGFTPVPVATRFDKAIEELTATDTRLDLPDVTDHWEIDHDDAGRHSAATDSRKALDRKRDLSLEEAIGDLFGKDELRAAFGRKR